MIQEATPPAILAIANQYETELLEQALQGRPDDFGILVRLGELYSALGRSRDGLTIDLQLVVIAPRDPIVRYNLACSLAMSGRISAGISALKEAVRLGYSDLDHLMIDEDLAAIRDDAEFPRVVEMIQGQVGESTLPNP